MTYGATLSAQLASCGVQIGGSGEVLPPPVSWWRSAPILSPDDQVDFAPENSSPVGLDLRFRDPSCRVAQPSADFCQRFVLEAQDLPMLCGCALHEVAVLGADLAVVGGDPPLVTDVRCSDTICDQNRRFFLVHRTSTSIDPVVVDLVAPIDAVYGGSGSIAFLAVTNAVFALDVSAARTSSIALPYLTHFTLTGSGSAQRTLAYSVLTPRVAGFAAGSTRATTSLELLGKPLALSGDSAGRIVALLVTTSATESKPLRLSTFEAGGWHDVIDQGLVADQSSRLFLSPSGMLLLADDIANHVFDPAGPTANRQVYFRGSADSSFRNVAPALLRSSYPAGIAVGGGFLFSFRQSLMADTVFGFDGKSTCDLKTAQGGSAVTRAPSGYSWNPRLGLGAWVSATATDVPRLVWFSMP
jgi:hypothetical protein